MLSKKKSTPTPEVSFFTPSLRGFALYWPYSKTKNDKAHYISLNAIRLNYRGTNLTAFFTIYICTYIE